MQSLLQKVLIVVPTFNGDHFTGQLAVSLKNTPYPVRFVDTSDGMRDVGALMKCYKENPNFDYYFLMHDSMIVKKPDFIEDFNNLGGEVNAWLKFPMFYDYDNQQEYIKSILGSDNAQYGIFGPIMLIPRTIITRIIEEGLYPLIPKDKNEQCAWERGWAVIFELLGIKVEFIDTLEVGKLEGNLYEHFRKVCPHRL